MLSSFAFLKQPPLFIFRSVERIRFSRKFASTSSSGNKRLLEKRAIITGSTSGIGLAIAEGFAKEGCNVMLNGFIDNAKPLCLQLSERYRALVEYHPADVSKPEQVSEMINEAVKKFGGIDILVSNAGIQHVSPVEEFPLEKWESILSVNLSSVFYGIRSVLPIMRKQKWGRLVNISSVHGLVASVNKSAYVASKHGVVGLTKTVALETAGSGITCNCLCPGWVRTPLVERQIEARIPSAGSLERAAVELLSEKQPSKQFVQLGQLVEATIFFCSEGAAQITGASLPIDGGWTAQ